ncbi:MAG: DUF2993 domain-containing protein [Catenulispora sp.]
MARRGRRSLVAFLVVVVVLIGLLAVADRVAVHVAENRIADQAVTEMSNRNITSPSKPDVSIGGFPFLTQVLAGTYQKVTIDVDHPKNGKVTLDHLAITADQVHAPLKTLTSHQGQVTSDRVQGTATLNWDTVRSLIDTTPLSQLPGLDASKLNVTVKDNKINMSAPVAFLGFRLTLQSAGTLAVAKGEVRVQIEDVKLTTANGGSAAVTPSIMNQYRDKLNVRIAVPQLPYALVVDKVQTSSSGVLVIATANNVVLAGAAQ